MGDGTGKRARRRKAGGQPIGYKVIGIRTEQLMGYNVQSVSYGPRFKTKRQEQSHMDRMRHRLQEFYGEFPQVKNSAVLDIHSEYAKGDSDPFYISQGGEGAGWIGER